MNPGPDNHSQEHVECIVRADGLVRESCEGDTIVESCFQQFKTFRQAPCCLYLVSVSFELQFVLDSKLVVEVLKGDSKASVWVPDEQHVICSAVLMWNESKKPLCQGLVHVLVLRPIFVIQLPLVADGGVFGVPSPVIV